MAVVTKETHLFTIVDMLYFNFFMDVCVFASIQSYKKTFLLDLQSRPLFFLIQNVFPKLFGIGTLHSYIGNGK